MTASVDRKSARHLASEILRRVDTDQAYADILLDHGLQSAALGGRDRALLTELVYGTLRWRGTLDGRLTRILSRPLADTDPFLRNLLRATLYQIMFLDKIPPYAAVNEAVEIAKLRGAKAAGFVNAVLRNFLRQTDECDGRPAGALTPAVLTEKFSHPPWLIRRWLADLGAQETLKLMRANNERAPLVLRANLLKCNREYLLERFERCGIEAQAAPWSPQGIVLESGVPVAELPGFAEGHFHVQGEASQLVSLLLDPRAGERVLDACAAPGGKATHIAELMRDEGEVIALDTSARGIRRLMENCSRLQLKSIKLHQRDASRQLGEISGAPYDRILVDAPCTGLGTLRSHPEIKWQRSEKDIGRLARLQAKILDNVARHAKSGGVLVYSTCTLTEEENEHRVEGFLRAHPEFELEDAGGYLPLQARRMTRGPYFQALPHRHDTDGFFAARLRKVS